MSLYLQNDCDISLFLNSFFIVKYIKWMETSWRWWEPGQRRRSLDVRNPLCEKRRKVNNLFGSWAEEDASAATRRRGRAPQTQRSLCALFFIKCHSEQRERERDEENDDDASTRIYSSISLEAVGTIIRVIGASWYNQKSVALVLFHPENEMIDRSRSHTTEWI